MYINITKVSFSILGSIIPFPIQLTNLSVIEDVIGHIRQEYSKAMEQGCGDGNAEYTTVYTFFLFLQLGIHCNSDFHNKHFI